VVLVLAALFHACYSTVRQFPSCTGRLRVCHTGEDAFFQDGEQRCSANKLKRSTVRLTGAGWRSSLYNLWIAQIILEEQMQVPVEIEHVNGGKAYYWEYEDTELDVLDGRLYSWDALHLATNVSMDCGDEARRSIGVPEDLQILNCTENCMPCAHAMLEVWPNGQTENYDHYIMELKTVEDGGRLGAVGEHGWWASKYALEQFPHLASYRGMRDVNSTVLFKRPFTFGEYCMEKFDGWQHIGADPDPFALNSSITAHFCHLFFEFAVLAEYDLVYDLDVDMQWHLNRDAILQRCATNENTTAGILFYNLCTKYHIIPNDLKEALPVAHSQLKRQGYQDFKFLFPGYFAETPDRKGILQSTTSCAPNSTMTKSAGAEIWDVWDRFLEDGYKRFENRDADIISSHGLQLLPTSMWSDVQEVLEVSARLLEDGDQNASPVLVSWYRPSSLFLRHGYRREDQLWGNYTGDFFELSKIQLPDFESAGNCEAKMRSYNEECSASFNLSEFQCGYEKQVLFKAFSIKLEEYASEAYEFLRRFQIGRDAQEEILAANDYDEVYGVSAPTTKARLVVCDWIRNNSEIWSQWIPPTSFEIRCLGELVEIGQVVATCSGHGSCESSDSSLTLHPNAGECRCDKGYRGDDCSNLEEPELLNVSIGTDMLFLAVSAIQFFTLCVVGFFYSLLLKYEKISVVFITSHPFFIRLILLCVTIAASGPSFWAAPTTIVHCLMRPVLIGMPFCVSQTAIFVKLNRKRLRLAMNSSDLWDLLYPLFLFFAGFFIVWFALFTPSVEIVRLDPEVWLKFEACDYGTQLAAFEGLLLVGGSAILLANCKTSYDLRDRPTYFNEGYQIRRTVFLHLLTAVVGYPLTQAILSPREREKYVIITSMTLTNCWIVLSSLLYPKFYVQLYERDRNNYKDGLFHPTGDPSLAIGDPVSNMPRVIGTIRNGIEKQATRRGALVPEKRKSSFFKRSSPAFTARARRMTARSFASRRSVAPINAHERVHQENMVDLAKLEAMRKHDGPVHLTVEEGVVHDPKTLYDPFKRGLAHRSPEMYLILEKRFQIVMRENSELTKIIQEHRIDPLTGEMDEDFQEALHRIKTEHELQTKALRDELNEKIAKVEQGRAEEKRIVERERRQIKAESERERIALRRDVEAQKAQARQQLLTLEEETRILAETLRGTLPPLKRFLSVHNLEIYTELLENDGIVSVEKLLVATEDRLNRIGVKPGHIRKLQRAASALRKSSPGPGWIENVDALTGSTLFINSESGETKWPEPTRHVHVQHVHTSKNQNQEGQGGEPSPDGEEPQQQNQPKSQAPQ